MIDHREDIKYEITPVVEGIRIRAATTESLVSELINCFGKLANGLVGLLSVWQSAR